MKNKKKKKKKKKKKTRIFFTTETTTTNRDPSYIKEYTSHVVWHISYFHFQLFTYISKLKFLAPEIYSEISVVWDGLSEP